MMKIDIIQAGRFALDGGAMFGVVPKALWNRSLPADDSNRIPMNMNLMLIQGEGRKILVDSGMGNKFDEKRSRMYAYEGELMISSLEEQGIKPEDITDVIITHMHFDHVGGITKRDSAGNIELTFPNAMHHINKKQWEWAQKPSPKDRASYMRENYEPLFDGAQLNLTDGMGELMPDVEIILVHGHTPGQQLVKVKADDGKHYIFMADLIPTHHHVPIPYVMAYDNEPLRTIGEKTDILKMAVEENWVAVFEHDRHMAMGKIVKGEKHYRAETVSF